MKTVATTSIIVVAALHVALMAQALFAWSKPIGLAFSKLSLARAEQSSAVASNLGLHQGFIAAGLAWSAWLGTSGSVLALFFLGCAVVAGVHAAAVMGRSFFVAQALPAGLALILVLVAAAK